MPELISSFCERRKGFSLIYKLLLPCSLLFVCPDEQFVLTNESGRDKLSSILLLLVILFRLLLLNHFFKRVKIILK